MREFVNVWVDRRLMDTGHSRKIGILWKEL